MYLHYKLFLLENYIMYNQYRRDTLSMSIGKMHKLDLKLM